MLVLCRRIGERIIIGENQEVFITVTRVEGGNVYIGIDAEKDVPIYREEVLKRIINEREYNILHGLKESGFDE